MSLETSEQILSQQINKLPKIELHRHLDCSMRFSTMLELAQQVGVNVPQTRKEQEDYFLIQDKMTDLESVLHKFLNAQKLLSSPEILSRLAFEVCEDAYLDGIRILELRYAPTFITDGHPSLNFQKIHNAFLEGIHSAQKKYNMAVGLICIIQRISKLEVAEKVVDFAIENKDTFIGIDLADNEIGFEPKPFAKYFEKAKAHGLHITIHTGEMPHPQSSKWIEDSINWLGAERIGHGIQCIHSENTMQILREKNIPLEVCPISNWLTQAFPTHKAHPAKKLIELGIPITINSDDPGIFNTKLSQDYMILMEHQNFTIDELKRTNQVAFKHSFLKPEIKEKYKHLFY